MRYINFSKNLLKISRVADVMVSKWATLWILGLMASVAVADDLDALLALEDKTKQQFDHQLNLRKIQNILNEVSSACLANQCFAAGELKIKIKANPTDRRLTVDLGGMEKVITADAKNQLLNNQCLHIGTPSSCPCLHLSEITRLHVRRQINDRQAIAIKSVELSWVTNDGSVLPIFREEGSWINAVNFSLQTLKNNGVFRGAEVGSCQN